MGTSYRIEGTLTPQSKPRKATTYYVYTSDDDGITLSRVRGMTIDGRTKSEARMRAAKKLIGEGYSSISVECIPVRSFEVETFRGVVEVKLERA